MYFAPHELACRHCGDGHFHPEFIATLYKVREKFGRAMKITSGARCLIHNTAVGGHPRSLHIFDKPAWASKGQLGALAVDVATPDGRYRGELFTILWTYGFSIGWNAKKNFLHADLRTLIGMPQTTFDY
jgi:hypothetical protein